MSTEQRFGGIARLYGRDGLARLRQARVAVVGIGGVGSWAAEALARSGVGHLVLMDMDDLCITNTNRQIHAMASTVGCMKTDTMAGRIRDISPDTDVACLTCFYTETNEERLFDTAPDLVVDAIDAMNPKAHLIAACYRREIPVVTCGGAGGRTDATRIEVGDLARTKGDPLLARLRKILKNDYGMPLGEGVKPLGIPCVFSEEKPVFPTCEGGISEERDPSFAGRMACDAGFGSVTHVTGTFGFLAAGAALNLLTQP